MRQLPVTLRTTAGARKQGNVRLAIQQGLVARPIAALVPKGGSRLEQAASRQEQAFPPRLGARLHKEHQPGCSLTRKTSAWVLAYTKNMAVATRPAEMRVTASTE